MSSQLLQFLRYQQRHTGGGRDSREEVKNGNGDLPRFQYCFYLVRCADRYSSKTLVIWEEWGYAFRIWEDVLMPFFSCLRKGL